MLPERLGMETCADRVRTAILIIAAGLSGCGQSTPAEHFSIEQELDLSPGHSVAAYAITPASNGDYIVTGANTLSNAAAWAIRVGSLGGVRWEYLDSPNWTDYSGKNNQFYGAVELANGKTLLCGVKTVAERSEAFMVRIDAQGKRLDERVLMHGGDVSRGLQCVRWAEGAAVLSDQPTRATGAWLTKLDGAGDIVWDRFGEYAGQAAPSNPGELLLLSDSDHGRALLKIGDAGEVLARRSILQNDPASQRSFLKFFPSLKPSTDIHVSAWFELAGRVNFMEFDHSLQGPLNSVEAHTIGMRKAIQLADGTFAIFGSQPSNPPKANIARVYGNDTTTNFALCPNCDSPWFYDAAPGRAPNEFVTLQNIHGKAIMSWVSLRNGHR